MMHRNRTGKKSVSWQPIAVVKKNEGQSCTKRSKIDKRLPAHPTFSGMVYEENYNLNAC